MLISCRCGLRFAVSQAQSNIANKTILEIEGESEESISNLQTTFTEIK